MFTIYHIICIFTFALAERKHLQLPLLTNFGTKGNWEYCPYNQFVSGFQLKTERELYTFGDDTALNSVKLFCSFIGDRSTQFNITSKEGLWGNWGNIFDCIYPSIGVGLELRQEEYQGIGDDTAVNNMKLYCSDKIKHEGDGTNWGEWTGVRFCDSRMAICGLRTQVEVQTKNDDTSLNGLEFACCDVPDPAENCKPKDRWKYILSCDNKMGTKNKTCLYNEGKGPSFFLEKSIFADLYENLGFRIDHSYYHLATRFKNFIGFSKKTQFNWTSFVASPENMGISFTILAPAGEKVHLYRLIGICGLFELRTQIFKTFSKELDPELTHFD